MREGPLGGWWLGVARCTTYPKSAMMCMETALNTTTVGRGTSSPSCLGGAGVSGEGRAEGGNAPENYEVGDDAEKREEEAGARDQPEGLGPGLGGAGNPELGRLGWGGWWVSCAS